VLIGATQTRPSPSDIIVFDSTGVAHQDVASAALVYERALERGLGAKVDLA